LFKENVVTDPWNETSDRREAPFERLVVPLFGPNLRGVQELNAHLVSIPPQSGTDYHTHVIGELIYIVSGTGVALMNDEQFDLKPDTVFWAPAGVFHHVRNTGNEQMKIFTVFAPGMVRKTQRSQIQRREPPTTTRPLD
jgi:mannose-6-phosphate isomerase-like protein (cupin superfamily)